MTPPTPAPTSPPRCRICNETTAICKGHAPQAAPAPTGQRRPCWMCGLENQVIDKPCERCGRTV